MPRLALSEPSIGSTTSHGGPSPPPPSPTTGPPSARPGSSPSTPRTSSTAARQAASQSVKRVEEQPGDELRREVGRLLGHDLAAPRALEDVRHRGRPNEERRL